MKARRPVLPGLGGLLVIIGTIAPTGAVFFGSTAVGPAVCSNPGCRCGVHEPGVRCCCASEEADEGPREGFFQAGCGRPDGDPPIPSADRQAVLTALPAGRIASPRGLSPTEYPAPPPGRPIDPLDHVPRRGA